MKKIYETAELEIVNFQVMDIVRTSDVIVGGDDDIDWGK